MKTFNKISNIKEYNQYVEKIILIKYNYFLKKIMVMFYMVITV